MSTEARGGLTTSTLALLLLWPLVVGAGTAYWCKRELALALAERPPVVFLDELEAVRSAPAQGSPEATARAAMDRSRQAGQSLAAAGYLVLDRRAVYAAPPDLEVTP